VQAVAAKVKELDFAPQAEAAAVVKMIASARKGWCTSVAVAVFVARFCLRARSKSRKGKLAGRAP
jgi:hypothetical protein